MKKVIFTLVIFILFSVSLAGCGDSDMEGIVLEANENYIKVATELSSGEYEKMKDKSASEIQDEDVHGDAFYGLVDVTYDHAEKFSKGDEVKIWIDGDVRESYPLGATAKKISLKK